MSRPRNPNKHTIQHCDNCKCEIEMFTNLYNQSISKVFYCSPNCRFNATRILQNCKYCNNEILVYRIKYEQSKTRNFFCNRKCFSLYWSTLPTRLSRYHTNYYCRNCEHFFPKKYCPIYQTSTGNLSYPTCPNKNCPRIKMQTRPRHTAQRKKFLKQVIAMNNITTNYKTNKTNQKKENNIPQIIK